MNNENIYPFYYKSNLNDSINKKINDEIIYYSSLYILKKLSIQNISENILFTIPLEGMNKHIEPILDYLFVDNLIEICPKNQAYILTKNGEEYVDNLISEIENYIEQYESYNLKERIELMKENNLSPFRIRFLWGLYDGEFDNIIEWKNSIKNPLLRNLNSWQTIITSPEFYQILYENVFNTFEKIDYIFFYEDHPDFNI